MFALKKVENFKNWKGRAIPNQFIISEREGNITRQTFQSYETIIAVNVQNDEMNATYLDINNWDYSPTTSRYRNQFLGENRKETEKKINSKEYKMVDLNP